MSIAEEAHARKREREAKWARAAATVKPKVKYRPYAPSPIIGELPSPKCAAEKQNLINIAKLKAANAALSQQIKANVRLLNEARASAEAVEDELSKAPNHVRMSEIVKAVCQWAGVSKYDLLSHRRTAEIVRPRQIGMYLAKHLTKRSLPDIGRAFGGKDHTTVIHAVRRIEAMIKDDEKVAVAVAHLKSGIAPEAILAPMGEWPEGGPATPVVAPPRITGAAWQSTYQRLIKDYKAGMPDDVLRDRLHNDLRYRGQALDAEVDHFRKTYRPAETA